ncbi:thiamine pyrophosphate-binding protein [Streptosporangiaceae bacterium NEAU-GS5]|nr:thiamine pyrophosphate-binding protein [Streptosporangiaceae bacterium NEAU-GS5]
MTETTFAVAFAQVLEDLGVRHAFGVSGGAISFFWSALGGTGIEVTHFRHESGAAFAACEASVASDAPVVVFVTTGPGLTNVLTGVYAARHEPARVILVSAFTDSGMHGRGPIQETGPRTLPHEGVFTPGPLFDIATVVTSSDELPALAGVLAEAVASRPRFVAHISLTLPAQRGPVRRAGVPPLTRGIPATPGTAVKDTYELLRDQRWVLWAGSGTRRAAGPVRRLADAAGVPVMATPRAKGVIAEDHPRYLGVTGFGGHPAVLAYLERERPEYTLVLGTALGDAACGYHPGYTPGTAFIHVDTDPSVPGKGYPEVKTVAVTADAGAFADELAALFEKRPATGEATPAVVGSPFAAAGPVAHGGRVHPGHLMEVVQAVFVENGHLVMAETGNAMAWAINRLRFTDPLHWRTPSGLVGSMGHCAAGVVGAALATSRKTVALVGDGSMLMLNEVSTAVATGAPAVWVVLNDSRYNMCAQGAEMLGLTNVDASLPATDFAGYARALGAGGISVRRPEELPGALLAALDHPGPVVVDVPIAPAIGAPTEGRNAGLLRQ